MFSPFKKLHFLYGKNDLELVETYIARTIGESDEVLHELVSPDIHVDIIPVLPTKERDYYTLVTMGMGAYRMKVSPEYEKSQFNRAELAIRLPRDWDTRSNDEKWYWPIRILKILARIPISQKSWLGYGHTIDYGQPVSNDAGFSAFILDFLFDDDTTPLRLTNGDFVLVYNVVPIYHEEMEYKNATCADGLFEMLGKEILKSPINVQRENRCKKH